MQNPVKYILAGWSAFAGTHLVMSHPPVRSKLVEAFGGEEPFKGVYSAVSLATLGPTIYVYARYGRGFGDLGWFTKAAQNNTALRATGNVVKLSGLISFGQGVATPGPKPGERAYPPGVEEPQGIYRILRHPVLTSFALLGLGNVLRTGTAAGVAYWGGYPAFWAVGCMHQDYRQRKEISADFYEKTSLVPFQAIVEGRNSLNKALEELNKPTIAVAIMSFLFWL